MINDMRSHKFDTLNTFTRYLYTSPQFHCGYSDKQSEVAQTSLPLIVVLYAVWYGKVNMSKQLLILTQNL